MMKPPSAWLAPFASLAPVAFAALGSLAVACGSSAAAQDDSVPTTTGDAGSSTGTSASASSSGATLGSSSSASGSTSTGSTIVDASTGSTGTTSIAPGAPITGLTAETWSWVPVPGAVCRDGSPTGIGISANPASTKVMIFLEGGYACFNETTCALNPSSFGPSDFATISTASNDAGSDDSINSGIFDRTNSGNPVGDWSYVYVPYCTGDVHAGNTTAPVAGVDDGASQHFAGYANISLALSHLVPTFPKASQVLLAGMSAGGFGVVANYAQVAGAFPGATVAALDDSGPMMSDPALATCLQNQLRSQWGLDSTIGAACNGNCNTPSTFFLDSFATQVSAHPNAPFGLVESTDDEVITTLFGFGFGACASFFPVSGTEFTGALSTIRSTLSANSNFGAFVFAGDTHTSIQDGNFYAQSIPGSNGDLVHVNEWVAQLLAGNASNIGP